MSVAAIPAPLASGAVRPRAWIVPLTLVISDIVALETCLALGCLVRELFLAVSPIWVGPQQYRGLALGMLALPAVYALNGFYPGYGMNPVERLRSRFHLTLAVFAVLMAWN